MVIYLDVLLAVNWVIDYLLLHATARLMSIPRKGWRLLLGATGGALFCVVVLLPDLPPWIAAACKVAAAVAMILVAFGRRSLLRRTAVLFLLSTAAAGLTAAVWWLAAPQGVALVNGVIYYDIPPLLLIGLVAAAYGLLCLYARWTGRRTAGESSYGLRVERAGRSVAIAALYDSGNGLTEPFSGAPVAVATYESMAPLLTSAWRESVPPPGARMIPFTSVGGEGLLPAFCPDRLIVTSERGEWDITGGYVAVTPRPLQKEYDALIGTAIIQNCQP